ncbi:MAG: 3-isopropylmalate dehydratase small subunit [Rhodospirillaceae bacterium TMED8]|nr:3-isopropylmalate dehydratase small subunit [Magnetovibrio sp.]OUT50235.1 MAG: 3-isopropylmalate dehydratase small subunit [Rhodospirillaceae bacterium TMED8]|tara:strand:- start:161 stop:784 length:624 start_codon:yes stop_codon:yes gene_type:complete
MRAFKSLTGIAAPLFRANINTDIIIPMQHLVGTDRVTMGFNVFAPWRYENVDGSRCENPNFILNQRPFRQSSILIAGPNFACGSSREGAVWALHSFGFRVVIAPSFGGIFANNCYQSGVLPIVLKEELVAALARQAEAAPHTATFTVDLKSCLIEPPQGEAIKFEVEAFRRIALLKGLDDLGMIKSRLLEIEKYRNLDCEVRPWIYL